MRSVGFFSMAKINGCGWCFLALILVVIGLISYGFFGFDMAEMG